MATTTDEHLLDVAEATIREAVHRLRHEPDYSREEIANDLGMLGNRLALRHPAVVTRERLRLVREDEIADEVLQGEHDDHDWQVD
jgi:hypothetical protein